MKSKITKIQNLLTKGIALLIATLMSITPMAYATSSLNDSYLVPSLVNRLLYGKVGATAKEIEEYFKTNTILYISNEVQLRALAEYVNSDSSHTCQGKTIVLLNDIVINQDVDWTPIGANIVTENDVHANGNNRITNLPDSDSETSSQNTPSDTEGTQDNTNIEDLLSNPEDNNPTGGEETNSGETSGEDAENVAPVEQEPLSEKEVEEVVKELEASNAYINSSTNHTFNGVFDGNGCTIYNLKFQKNGKSYSELKRIGLFGTTGKDAIIKNVNTYNFNIDILFEAKDLTVNSATSVPDTLYYCAGNIVGYNNGTIENCTTNSSNISGANCVGGIAGSSTGTIKNCKNNSKVQGFNSIGGIAGYTDAGLNNEYTNAKIENCENTGIVNARNGNAGGITGSIDNKCTIKSCYNKGKISTETLKPSEDVARIDGFNIELYHRDVGGIVGRTYQTDANGKIVYNVPFTDANKISVIEDCINDGNIRGYYRIAGIAANTEGTKISNCINNGVIYGENSRVAGIVGEAENTLITYASNTATIESKNNSVGGIVGFVTSKCQVDHSYCKLAKTEYIKGNGSVGGIVGYCYDELTNESKFMYNFCQAPIRGYSQVGGIAGTIQGNSTVERCWYQDVLSTDLSKPETFDVVGAQKVAGIVGYLERSTVKNCVNTGEISSIGAKLGGIAGVGSGCTIELNVNLGEIVQDVYHWETDMDTKKSTYKYDNHPILKEKSKNITSFPQGAGGIVGVISGNSSKFDGSIPVIVKENRIGQGSVIGCGAVGGIAGVVDNSKGYSIAITKNYRESNTAEDVLTYKKITYKENGTQKNSTLKNVLSLSATNYDGINENGNYAKTAVQVIGKIYGGYVQKNSGIYIEEKNSDEILSGEQFTNSDNSGTVDYKNDDGKQWKDLNSVKVVKNANKTYDIVNTRTDTYCSDFENSNIKQVGSKLTANEVGIKSVDAYYTTLGENVNVTYKLFKTKAGETNKTQITSETYLKTGDILTVEATFDKYLGSAYGPVTPIANDALSLKLNNSKETTGVVAGNTTDYTTTITYTYTVQEGDEFDVNTLNLIQKQNENIYVLIKGETYSTSAEPKKLQNINNSVSVSGVHLDTKAPTVTTTAYVENALANGRYTAGKEILIEAVTSEPIFANVNGMPTIQVNFTESGKGKFNYQGRTSNDIIEGYAKPVSANNLADGRTAWLYSYQIQEGDNGNLQLQYIRDDENHSNLISDRAGNTTDLATYAQSISIDSSSDAYSVALNSNIVTKKYNSSSKTFSGPQENASIKYSLYKNNTNSPIVGTTYIKPTDKLIVKAEIPGFVYANIANTTTGSEAKLVDANTAPKLQIGNITDKAAKSVSVNIASPQNQTVYSDACTTITYEIKGSEFNYNKVKKLENIKLSNTNLVVISNRYVQETNGFENGSTEDIDENQDGYVDGNVDVERFKIEAKAIPQNTISEACDISGLNIYVDPIGISELFHTENVYADTKKPTVEIIARNVEGGKTKENTITYEFKWSEKVIGFTEDDITVNGGEKVSNTFSNAIDNHDGTYSYTINVNTSIENESEGNVQVIIEQDAVQDLAYQGNVRKESIITIDKVAPTVEITANKDVINVGEEITYTFNWSEAVKDFAIEDIIITNVKQNTEEESENIVFTNVSDTQYTLKVISENGNDIVVTVPENKCTDIAGNNNKESKNVIGVRPTVKIIPVDTKFDFNNDGKIDNSDLDLLQRYLSNQDTAEFKNNIVTNGDINKDGRIDEIDATTLQRMIIGLIDGIKITNSDTVKYLFIWSEKVNDFTMDDVTVNGGIKSELSGPIYVEANKTYIYMMNIKTAVENGNTGDLQVIVEQDAVTDDVGLGNVRTENEITVDRQAPILISLEAIGESNLDISNIDSVKEQFKTGDTVKVIATFNENIQKSNAPELKLQFSESGNAKGAVIDRVIEGNKITYSYKISNGDKGILSVKGFTGTVRDIAGNETIVTKRTLDGNTVIADSEVPKVVGITAIAPDFVYDDLLSYEGETKRYGKGTEIKFLVEFNENIYNLSNNTLNVINETTAPKLNIKFGDGQTREATFRSIDGKIIEYYYIIGNNDKQDNGKLSLVNITGAVSDIAGNKNSTLNLTDLAEYEAGIKDENKVDEIVADTTAPKVTLKTTEADNCGLTGTGNNYKAGAIVTITATTNELVYIKGDNNTLTQYTPENAGQLLGVKFGTNNANGQISCIKVKYTPEGTIFTYEYIIETNDNGEMSLSFNTSACSDIALNVNGNVGTDGNSKKIVADTILPNTSHLQGTNDNAYIRDNGDGTYSVLFTEKLYSLENNVREDLVVSNTKNNAPTLVLQDGEEFKTVNAQRITLENGATLITYNYGKAGVTRVGLNGYDKICDKAGNMYNANIKTGLTISNIKITKPEDKTKVYGKGTEVEILVTFNKRLGGNIPTLALVFGDGETRLVTQGTIDRNTITYKYTIGDGDNGELSIVSIDGTNVKAEDGSEYQAPDSYSITGGTITADTVPPTATITSNVKSTNRNTVEYTITWSEPVYEFDIDDIEVINGLKGTLTPTTSGENKDKVYTLEVDSINEGRQIVKIPSLVCKDEAGNWNEERAVYSDVILDYTKPEVRAKVNGGKYVIDNDKQKSLLKEIIVVNEEMSEFKYAWSTSQTTPTSGWTILNAEEIGINSDIPLSVEVDNAATYYLYIEATDVAGNKFTGRTNEFVVSNDTITITLNKEEVTNSDIIATVSYGTGTTGLTENRKAGVQGKTQSADPTKVIITENGVVYAEATDKNGNKVYATLEVSNIDKTAPTANITYVTNDDGSVTATITLSDGRVTNNNGETTYTFTENGEFIFEFVDDVGNKGTAVAKVTTISGKDPEPTPEPKQEDIIAPEVTFNSATTTATVGTRIGSAITTNEDAKISYKWNNGEWRTSNDFIRSYNITYTPATAGTYTLYAKAVDIAGNESEVKSLEFTIVNSGEEIEEPEIVFEDLTVLQKNGVKYVKVSPTYTIEELTSKMNKDLLLGKTPTYTKLTSDNKLRTGSEIKLNGETKYVVIVNGDVNCDGKVDFINDVIMINNYRIGKINNLSEIQILAGDIDNSGTIEFLSDIVTINNYRLGRITTL